MCGNDGVEPGKHWRKQMKQYKKIESEEQVVETMYCNKCGKAIVVENNILKEGVFQGVISWGYFSDKDGETHEFDICENCYDTFVKSFTVPVNIQGK